MGRRRLGSAPALLDAAVIFAPAGISSPALAALDKGGVLVLGGIHMSPIPPIPYPLLYGERTIRTVTNNTREDGRAFLAEAAAIPVRTRVEAFPLSEANRALAALANDAIRGARSSWPPEGAGRRAQPKVASGCANDELDEKIRGWAG